MEPLMTQILSQFSEAVMALTATASPSLTAIRIGQNRQVTGFLWHGGLVVTTDQALPAAASYTVVLSNGALIPARPGPRDPVHDLAALFLDGAVQVTALEAAAGTAVGAIVLALGTEVDASPTARLTTIHAFPHTQGATITLDLAGNRASPGGMIVDTAGKLLGMCGVGANGDAIVIPHGVIARFVEAATGATAGRVDAAGRADLAVRPIPRIAVSGDGAGMTRETVARGPKARGWLGVSLQPITVPDNLVNRAGQPTARQVVNVMRGGPADDAGLRSGDVLLSIDGVSTSGGHALRAFLAPDKIGADVEVRLLRDGVLHTTIMTIAAQPET